MKKNLSEKETFSSRQPLYLQYLGWDCDAECRYSCMWKTVHDFQLDGSDIPQFYGKVCFHIVHSSLVIQQATVHCVKQFYLFAKYYTSFLLFCYTAFICRDYSLLITKMSVIPTGSPPTEAPNRGGIGYSLRFSTNILLYLRNGAR